jgi:hypothetical protein
VLHVAAAAEEDSAAEPQLFGDWREFRAKLILGELLLRPQFGCVHTAVVAGVSSLCPLLFVLQAMHSSSNSSYQRRI